MKSVFVGFDGANPELIERFLPELPNFRRLIESGAWGAMSPMAPADTPTNWCSLATGATPSTHRITGFECFEPGASLTQSWGPTEACRRLRAAEFLWEAAERQDRTTLLVNYPFGWFSKEGLEHTVVVGGDSIKGGAPQIRGAACYCTRDRLGTVQEAEKVELRPDGGGYVADLLAGPAYKTAWTDVGQVKTGEKEEGGQVWAKLRTRPGDPLEIQSPDGETVCVLKPGEWSPLVRLAFGQEPGWVRFLLVDLSKDGRSLHLTHFMMTREGGWTRPPELSERLLREIGPYQQGLEADGGMDRTNGLGTTPLRMCADVDLLRFSGETLVGYADVLTRDYPQWDHLYIQFHSTDGYNHRRLAKLLPEDYPLASAEETRLATEWLLENYRATDEILGRMADMAASAGALLVVVSDHSACPSHTWVDDMRPFLERGWIQFDAEGNWDPARSRIRSSSNRSIYVNLKGRQPDGIVEPGDYEAVRDEIVSTLLSLRDPRTGCCPVALAARREDLGPIGADGEVFGDVLHFMRPGYTNSPGTHASRPNATRLEYNLADADAALKAGYGWHKGLLGSHIDYLPDAVYPGFCSNRSILLLHGPGIRRGHRIGRPRTIDVAPTIALLCDAPLPAGCEGSVLTNVME